MRKQTPNPDHSSRTEILGACAMIALMLGTALGCVPLAWLWAGWLLAGAVSLLALLLRLAN